MEGPPTLRAVPRLTCRFATVVKGQRLREEIVECGRLSDHGRITLPVTFCTGYADQRHASIREMEEIAWILRSDPQRHNVGFVRASDLKPHETIGNIKAVWELA